MKKNQIWKLFIASALLQLIGSWVYFVVLENAIAIQGVYLLTKVLMIFSPVILLYVGFSLPKISFKKNIKQSLLFGIGTGTIFAVAIFTVYFLFRPWLEVFAEPISLKIQNIGIADFYWEAAIGISFLHSLFEEYYWRWFVVSGFGSRLAPLRATILGNSFFTLHHFIILSQLVSWPLALLFGIGVGTAGCLWSHIYKKTESLLGSWISHIFADLAIFLVVYLLSMHT